MNRGALAYIVTPVGVDFVPIVGTCVIEQRPDGYRVAVDDGSGARWYPIDGVTEIVEDDDSMTLRYSTERGRFGETGLMLEPVTVERWNALAQQRPEMKPVFDFDDMVKILRGLA
jgi:hypothetical protein